MERKWLFDIPTFLSWSPPKLWVLRVQVVQIRSFNLSISLCLYKHRMNMERSFTGIRWLGSLVKMWGVQGQQMRRSLRSTIEMISSLTFNRVWYKFWLWVVFIFPQDSGQGRRGRPQNEVPDCPRCHQYKRMTFVNNQRRIQRSKGVPACEIPKFNEAPLPSNPLCILCQDRKNRLKSARDRFMKNSAAKTERSHSGEDRTQRSHSGEERTDPSHTGEDDLANFLGGLPK